MTVKELIERLSELPADADVWVYSHDRYDDSAMPLTAIEVYSDKMIQLEGRD